MAVTSYAYANALTSLAAKGVNWTSDTLKVGLLSSSYTPNLATDSTWSGISADEITGTGYTAGGATVTSPTATITAADSWATSWAASTVYTAGTVIRPSTGNGYLYQCITGGTSGSAAPTWPTTVGDTVTDNTATWTCVGQNITVLSSATVTWTTATFSTSFAALYDSGSGDLLVLVEFGASESPAAVDFSVAPDANLGWLAFFS